MKLALIPPTSLLSYTMLTSYQLLLPHMLTEDIVYAAHWRLMCNDPRHFKMLDNGEAEGQNKYSTAELVKMALTYQCDEVIAHDVMGNAPETLIRTTKFLKEAMRMLPIAGQPLDIGIVAQGQTYSEVKGLISLILDMDKYAGLVGTIHLPRHLVTTIERNARLNLAEWINEEYDLQSMAIDIHFLGANGVWPGELQAASRSLPYVRGMDTSMPFNYAYAGQIMSSVDAVSRPADYFDLAIHDFEKPELLHHNVITMVKWAYGA
jgi:hypothetical protein